MSNTRISKVFSVAALLTVGLSILQPKQLRASEGPTLSVLTLNMWLGDPCIDFDRIRLQIEKVRELNPDVVCLQEVYDNRAASLYRAAFEDYTPVSLGKNSKWSYSMIARIGAHFRADSKKCEHDVNDMIDGDKYGVMTLLNKGRGELRRQDRVAHTLHTQAGIEEFSFLERVKPRGVIEARWEADGELVNVFNTHLSNQYINQQTHGFISNPRKVEQAKELSQWVKKQTGDLPAIVCMDSNSDGAEPEMRLLRNQANWIDSYLAANPVLAMAPHQGMTWDNLNPNVIQGSELLVEPDQRVDYVYAIPGRTKTFEVVASKIVFDQPPYVSDHYGVLTTLRMVPKQD